MEVEEGRGAVVWGGTVARGVGVGWGGVGCGVGGGVGGVGWDGGIRPIEEELGTPRRLPPHHWAGCGSQSSQQLLLEANVPVPAHDSEALG